MKCYYCGCNKDGKVEHLGGFLCHTHYDAILPKIHSVQYKEVFGRDPEPYIGENDPKEWDLVRDLSVRFGFKMVDSINNRED